MGKITPYASIWIKIWSQVILSYCTSRCKCVLSRVGSSSSFTYKRLFGHGFAFGDGHLPFVMVVGVDCGEKRSDCNYGRRSNHAGGIVHSIDGHGGWLVSVRPMWSSLTEVRVVDVAGEPCSSGCRTVAAGARVAQDVPLSLVCKSGSTVAANRKMQALLFKPKVAEIESEDDRGRVEMSRMAGSTHC